MAKKQATYTSDLALLARVFVRYRSGLDVNFPECQELIAVLNEAGLDVLNMETHELLALYPAPEVEPSATSFVEVDSELETDFPVDDDTPEGD